MTKRMIEVNDVLPDCVASAIEETEKLLRDYLRDNPDADDVPCLSNDLDYDGRFHEIVDGCVPVYDADIDAAWFLHGRELEQAYENAGFGENPVRGGVVQIYAYIEEKAREWYHDHAEEIFEEFKKGVTE